MMSKGQKPSLVMDGWWSAGNRRMDGIVVSIGKESFPLSVATAEPDHDDNDSAVARAMQTILEKHKNHIVHCMDNAGPCASVRRTLQLVHSNILFTTCFAHQINLMVKNYTTPLSATTACWGMELPRLADEDQQQEQQKHLQQLEKRSRTQQQQQQAKCCCCNAKLQSLAGSPSIRSVMSSKLPH